MLTTLTTKYKKSANREKLILASILFLLLAFYYLLYFNKTFPLTEGWGINYIKLIENGKFPYRDFYFYLPPLNLLVDEALWKLSFGYFIVYRTLRLLERILLMEIIFFQLTKYFNYHNAFIACIIGGILRCAPVWDLLGDYNQTADILVVVVSIFASSFVSETLNNKKCKKIFVCGILMGVLFFMKQPHAVACALAYIVFLVCYCSIEKDKSFWKYVLFTLLGFLVPTLLTVLFLLLNNALIPFINQVYMDTSSKGSLKTLLVTAPLYPWVNNYFGSIYVLDFIVAVIMFFFLRKVDKKGITIKKAYKFLPWELILLVCYYLYWRYSEGIFNIIQELIIKRSIALFIIMAVVILVCFVLAKKKHSYMVIGIYLLFYILCFRLVSLDWNGIAEVFYFNNSSYYIKVLANMAYYSSFVLLLYSFIKRKRKGNWYISVEFTAFAVCALINCIAGAMTSNKSGLPANMLTTSVPIFICILLRRLEGFLSRRVILAGYAGLFFGVFIMSAKVVMPYNWWGWTDRPLIEKTKSVSVAQLKGFKFSSREKELYEQIPKVIRVNSDENDTVWYFPHIPIFNLLSERYNTGTFVPIYFFDVCSDYYARNDAKTLLEHSPHIVVWCDVGNNCWTTHEKVFRDGHRCGQRDIQEWFYSVQDQYQLIGQVENVFVYLNRDTEPRYTYIQNAAKTNETILKKNLRYDFSKLCDGGSGTREDSYRISNAAQLIAFSELVNAGQNFENEYICQTSDINMDRVEFSPIGNFSSDKYFLGVYNGMGHTIDNLTINAEDENAGLFGKLGGKVFNVGLRNCNINGVCVGAIASHSVGNSAAIVNCWSTGKLSGYRAGAIADNFSGTILNCYSTCELNASEANLRSYVDGGYFDWNLNNCYILRDNIHSNKKVDENVNYIDESFIEMKLCDKLSSWVKNESTRYFDIIGENKLCDWNIGSEKLPELTLTN